MTEQAPSEPTPPYVSFQTLLNQIDRMASEGVPGRIDGTYLVGMAGGTQNQLKHALRSLGLIEGPEDRPSTALRQLVADQEARPKILADLLQHRYPRLVSLEQDATMGHLDEVLAGYGLGTDTRRKAATFYLAAAAFAGIPLSPLFKTSKVSKVRKATTGSAAKKSVGKGSTPSGQSDSVPGPGTMVGGTTLHSGGTVTISVNANLFELSDDDQEFVTNLVKTLRTYKGTTPTSSVIAPEAPADREEV